MTRIPAGKMEYHSLPSFYGLTATLMTPSAFDSNKQYAASMSSNGNVCVISGVVSILPSAIKARIRRNRSRKWTKSIFVQAAAKSRTCSDYGEAQPKMDEVKPAAKRLTTH